MFPSSNANATWNLWHSSHIGEHIRPLRYLKKWDLKDNSHYHQIAVVPYGTEVAPIGLGTYVIWRYEP